VSTCVGLSSRGVWIVNDMRADGNPQTDAACVFFNILLRHPTHLFRCEIHEGRKTYVSANSLSTERRKARDGWAFFFCCCSACEVLRPVCVCISFLRSVQFSKNDSRFHPPTILTSSPIHLSTSTETEV